VQEVHHIGVFEVADWLWSWRWLALTMVILGAAGTVLMLQTGEAPAPLPDNHDQPEYEITLQVYAAGTPVRGLVEIADILGTKLQNDDAVLTSPWATLPVVFRANTREEAVRTVARAEEISDQLTAEVQGQADALEKFLDSRPVPDPAMSQFIRSLAFTQGIEDGLIDVVRGTVKLTRGDASSPFRSRTALIAPLVFAGLGFFLIAGGVTFARSWRRHRLAGASR
jgi:hypothetical protein